MAYTIINPIVGMPAIDVITEEQSPVVALGQIVDAYDPDLGFGEFIYLKGIDSTVLGSAVTFNRSDCSTTLSVAGIIGPMAFAMGETVTGTFGWYQITGKAVGKVLAGFADNANCYLTATAGSLDDADVAGDYVYKCKGASAIGTPAAGLAYLEIDRPFTNDGLDN